MKMIFEGNSDVTPTVSNSEFRLSGSHNGTSLPGQLWSSRAVERAIDQQRSDEAQGDKMTCIHQRKQACQLREKFPALSWFRKPLIKCRALDCLWAEATMPWTHGWSTSCNMFPWGIITKGSPLGVTLCLSCEASVGTSGSYN